MLYDIFVENTEKSIKMSVSTVTTLPRLLLKGRLGRIALKVLPKLQQRQTNPLY